MTGEIYDTLGKAYKKFARTEYYCKCRDEAFDTEEELLRHIMTEHHTQSKQET